MIANNCALLKRALLHRWPNMLAKVEYNYNDRVYVVKVSSECDRKSIEKVLAEAGAAVESGIITVRLETW